MKQPSEPNENLQTRVGISRREMVQKLMGGASTGVIAATVGAGQPIAGMADAPPAAESSAPIGESTPPVLDGHQNDTLVVLSELIVPGSTKAEVAPFIDLLLSVDTIENRQNFIASLSAMDGEALRRYDVPFKSLNNTQQIEILTFASKPEPGTTKENQNPLRSNSAAAQVELVTLHDHFENLKTWITKAYYSSEIGMRELGWSDSYFYTSLPPSDGPTT
jgi:hypothetical protein